jgi:hypothetical protein
MISALAPEEIQRKPQLAAVQITPVLIYWCLANSEGAPWLGRSRVREILNV